MGKILWSGITLASLAFTICVDTPTLASKIQTPSLKTNGKPMSLFHQSFQISPSLEKKQKALQEKAGAGLTSFFKSQHPLLSLPEAMDDLSALEDLSKHWRQKFDHLLVFGTGGSNLGAKALCRLKSIGYNAPEQKPHLHFVDNVDPLTFHPLLESLPWDKTAVLIISKSGSTAETLCQTHYVLQKLPQSALKDQVWVITSPQDSPLKRLAQANNITCLDHDPNLGGRFSVFSLVGLLPAILKGVDVRQVRLGAQQVLKQAQENPAISPAARGAAFAVAAAQTNQRTLSVMMPYLDQLDQFSKWYRQLWAESIGKQGKGTTPIDALGTVDQHSQIQLYLDGPRDKTFTVITLKTGSTQEVPLQIEDPALSYLNGRTMFDLLQAEGQATLETLVSQDHPVRHIELDALNEEVLGALMMSFMLETIATAALLEVDPLNQPAVEEGKRLTKAFLSDAGVQTG
ncbi:MAG: glucose-6-phosphate isomerase [bacterium]|nr:glucose-6-phosphate isomerase [bacterium]